MNRCLSNSASVTAAESESQPSDNSATETTAVTTSIDLAIAKSDSPDPVTAGQPLTYTLTVSNAGPSSASVVEVSDTLPAGVAFQSASGTGWGCTEADGVVTCMRATLAVGPAPEITITVTAPNEATTLTNSASVTAAEAESQPSDNSATESTTVTGISGAVLSLVKSGASTIGAGEVFTYTLTVFNAGPSVATFVVVEDDLPEGVKIVSLSPECEAKDDLPNVSCTIASLEPGSSHSFVVTVEVGNLPAGTQLVNVAGCKSFLQDPDSCSAELTTTVVVVPD